MPQQSFAVFLADLNDGATQTGLTADFYDLLQAVRDRIERVIDDAFNGYIEQVRANSGYAVLIGSPD